MKLSDENFKLQLGVNKEVFNYLVEILRPKYEKAHVKGSNKGIGVECRLILSLSYWREYRGMRQMAFDYEISLSTVCNSIHWVEDTLMEHSDFNFGNIEEEITKLINNGINVETIIGDVEEQPIERPINNQEIHYSGKKKRHTTKNQIIIEEKTGTIINIFNAKATNHDFKMLKDSNVIDTLNKFNIMGKFDSGYQGVQNLMTTSLIPYKKSKNHDLTETEKNHNKNLASTRIKIEHVNRRIKIFRIMKESYRNHQNRYILKLSIICTLYNKSIA